MDLVIQNGLVVNAHGTQRLDVGIQGERIAAIGEGLSGAQTIDATGLYILPGAIDVHVHLQMPVGEFTSSDDFYTGTVAAACGGTTTVIDFVEPKPDQTLMDALAARRAQADDKVVVDYGLHMTLDRVDPDALAEIPIVMEAGTTTFKLYLTYALRLEDEDLLTALEALSAHRGLPIVHAENHAVIEYLRRKLLGKGQTGPTSHPLSRPAHMEGEATLRALGMAEAVGVPMYIVHVSCADSLAAVRGSQGRRHRAFGETCPQYLLLDDSLYARPDFQGTKYVLSPPLRTPADQAALWAALADGGLSTIATDHCPFFFKGAKDRYHDDFTKIPGGGPGIEARLALVHTFGVRAGHISLERWVDVCCTSPARLFGLAGRKGEIAVGADADVVLFDPTCELTLTAALLHENVDYTPYEGFRLTGYPVLTIARGKVIVREGEFVGQQGAGRYLVRGVSSAFGN